MEGFDPRAVAAIRLRLDEARASGVRILFAIESGSRAWGFPSPDSDYDCRFVYTRPPESYLSLFPPRDVIEFPLDAEIDVGGWDLRKALLLALKGNAVIVEWLKSPLVYEEEPGVRLALERLLNEIAEPSKVARHYVGLLWEHFRADGEATVKLKKLLYAVRPAVALTWMEQREFKQLPPMSFTECLEEVAIPMEWRASILELIAAKKLTRELGEGVAPEPIAQFLRYAVERYGTLTKRLRGDPTADASARHKADIFYLDLLSKSGGASM